jgi:hypothetical protein
MTFEAPSMATEVAVFARSSSWTKEQRPPLNFKRYILSQIRSEPEEEGEIS